MSSTSAETARAIEIRIAEIALVHVNVADKRAQLTPEQRESVHRQLQQILLEIARGQTSLIPNKQQLSEARRQLQCQPTASRLSD